MQSIAHGLVVAPMLLIIVLLAERSAGSEDIRDMGGIAFRAPVLAALFLVATLATLAMPGSANFVGEFLILFGTFQDQTVFAYIAAIGVVLAAVYALRLYIRAMHNRTGPAVRSFDMSVRDGLVLVPLVVAIVAFSVDPQPALEDAERSVKRAIAPVLQASGEARPQQAASGVQP
jgi:NADH-quinone oxidoreductase subunit M